MLILLFLIMIVFMLVSMIMAIVLIRSEEKTWMSKSWIVLSCFSVFALMGIGYVMLGKEKTQQVAEQSQQLSGHEAAGQNEQRLDQESERQPELPKVATESEKPVPIEGRTPESYEYLVEVLDSLKKGGPIPEKYLDLLPESDREKIQKTR